MVSPTQCYWYPSDTPDIKLNLPAPRCFAFSASSSQWHFPYWLLNHLHFAPDTPSELVVAKWAPWGTSTQLTWKQPSLVASSSHSKGVLANVRRHTADIYSVAIYEFPSTSHRSSEGQSHGEEWGQSGITHSLLTQDQWFLFTITSVSKCWQAILVVTEPDACLTSTLNSQVPSS